MTHESLNKLVLTFRIFRISCSMTNDNFNGNTESMKEYTCVNIGSTNVLYRDGTGAMLAKF